MRYGPKAWGTCGETPFNDVDTEEPDRAQNAHACFIAGCNRPRGKRPKDPARKIRARRRDPDHFARLSDGPAKGTLVPRLPGEPIT